MKKMVSLFWILATLVVVAICIAPVTAAVTPAGTTAAASGANPYVTATVSASSVPAGTPITVSGTSTGSAPEVQVWVFAGNYVNVSTVPVKADRTYSKTYNTAGIPAGTYYVFVQNPGADNKIQVTTSSYYGAVVNTNTGAVIFNFTGTGSVTGDAAAVALTNALSAPGVDDIYAKAQFAINPSGGTPAATPAMMPGSDRDAHGCIGSAGYTWCEAKQKCLRQWEEPCTAATAPAPTKSPVLPVVAVAALAGAGALVLALKKQ
jgi:hypothetical protein